MLLVLLACAPEAPPWMAGLDGEWNATFSPFDGSRERVGTVDLAWDDDEGVLTGQITMVDPDGERAYDLLGAEDIEDLGVALQLVEAAGVRQLFVETAKPEGDAVIGGWRTRWGCDRGVCGEDGALVLSR